MIKIRGLTKKYGSHIAVDNLTLDIYENEVFGLLGSNGAGKTTTIHMLATLLKPSLGSATINGYDIVCQPAKVRSSIGIVFRLQAAMICSQATKICNYIPCSIVFRATQGSREWMKCSIWLD